MIEVLGSWLFIAITSYVIGFEALNVLYKLLSASTDTEKPDISHIHVLRCLLGLCAVNVYAEIISLFGGVGMWADYLLMLICLVIVFFDRERIGKAVSFSDRSDIDTVRTGLRLVLIFIMAYGTSRGYMHFDTNLYHAQAIHWIEDYGLVPGLANLQSRFGYNSAEFALNAIYGLKWYIGRSLHTSAGFFALLSSFVVVGICDDKEKAADSETNGFFGRLTGFAKRIRVSDYVRIGLLFYLGMIYTEMISPASDYYATLLIFDIVIIWLDILHGKNDRIMSTKSTDKYPSSGATALAAIQGILCILLVYAVTIKLSLAPLVLLALVPGIYWIRTKDPKAIITCLLSGLVISIPYFIRGYYISGWILYPSTLIRTGSPDWQIPKGMAQYDAREIGMWGRGIIRAEDWANVTAFNWIKDWFTALGSMEKLMVIATFVSIIVAVAGIIWALACRNKKTGNGILILLVVLSAGAVFWFCSAPLVRYGHAYLCILPFATLGYLMSVIRMKDDRLRTIAFAVIFTGITAVRITGLYRDIYDFRQHPYYVNQQDYIDGDAFTYTVDGVTVYVAEDAGQIGYYKIPATVEERHDFALRGSDISDGFRHRE